MNIDTRRREDVIWILLTLFWAEWRGYMMKAMRLRVPQKKKGNFWNKKRVQTSWSWLFVSRAFIW